jgi:hypothetical protein
MKKIFTILLLLMMGLAGCSAHFYRVQGNLVRIYLKKPKAETVSFAYSKDGFQLHEAQKINKKTWMVVVPADGEFSYFYIVDGKGFQAPCNYTEKDDFGSENCIFIPNM